MPFAPSKFVKEKVIEIKPPGLMFLPAIIGNWPEFKMICRDFHYKKENG